MHFITLETLVEQLIFFRDFLASLEFFIKKGVIFGMKIQSTLKVPDSIFRLYVWRKRRGMYRLASGWLHPKPICNKRCQLWKWKRRHDMKKKSQWMQKKIIIYCTSSHCAIVNADRQSSSSSGEKNRARKDIGIRIKNISDTHKFYIAALLNY